MLGVNIMKSTGMVRGIDKMGRVVLPTETRKLLNLVAGKSAVEIYTDDDSIVLKKYVPACIFCDSVDDIVVSINQTVLIYSPCILCKAHSSKTIILRYHNIAG